MQKTGVKKMRTALHSFLLRQKKAGERLREKRRQRGIEHAGLDFICCFVGKIIVFCDADYGYLRMTRKYTLFSTTNEWIGLKFKLILECKLHMFC